MLFILPQKLSCPVLSAVHHVPKTEYLELRNSWIGKLLLTFPFHDVLRMYRGSKQSRYCWTFLLNCYVRTTMYRLVTRFPIPHDIVQ